MGAPYIYDISRLRVKLSFPDVLCIKQNLEANCRLYWVDQVYIKEDGTLIRNILGQHVCTAPAFVVRFSVYRLYIFPECLVMLYFSVCVFQRSVLIVRDFVL